MDTSNAFGQTAPDILFDGIIVSCEFARHQALYSFKVVRRFACSAGNWPASPHHQWCCVVRGVDLINVTGFPRQPVSSRLN